MIGGQGVEVSKTLFDILTGGRRFVRFCINGHNNKFLQ